MLRLTPIDDSAAEGRTIEYMGIPLKIARGNNDAFKAKLRSAMAPYGDKDLVDLPDETSTKIMAESLAGTVLVGWETFEIDGEEIEFSIENAIELLKNDPDCLSFIVEKAGDINNFLTEQKAKVVKK